ncbi:ABC transporter substrate-binding protein [Occultella aeris]|uniref:Heme-binding protein A n=1 Tax=Occultella aeris TaxID=2761496 RepID=A0A7M4DHE0_9MICO|nr:ABC transporter substrate-binding protein [Occultella aeris]VZO36333.1 Heme-binding protein A precursor [Occultella aeris]
MFHRTRFHRLLAGAAAVATGLSLAACSAGGGDDGGAGSGGGAPAAEQTLTVAPGTFPVALDPHQWSAEAAVIGPIQHVMETLVARDGDGFAPLLASSWENPDETTWVFHMNPDATFSDGTPVTAEDARASVQRLVDIGGSMAPLFALVETIEATDEATLTLTTSQPLGTMLNTMSLVFVGQAAAMDSEDYWRAPVGSGQFTVSQYLPDERLTLTRNDDYWGATLPTLDTLTFTNIPEEAARISALSTGEIDLMTGIGADSVPELQGMDGIVYDEVPSFTYQLLWFNSSREPFTDPRVRQAMWHAVDIEQIVSDLFGTQATVAQAPIPQPVFGAPQLEPYSYDPELARELLAEAGYPDGFSTSLQWSDAGGEGSRSLAQAFISAWAEIGVTVEPLAKERAVWLEDLNNLNWDMNLQGNTVATGDADYTLGRLYLCEANRMGYCNPELDALLNEAKASLDQDVRADLYAQAAQIIWDDAVGIFPMDMTSTSAYSERVEGVTIDPGGRTSYADVVITE